MSLTSRLARRGLGPDYKPLTGAEAFMAGELDDAHLLAEHRAACDELRRLRAELDNLHEIVWYVVGLEGESWVVDWLDTPHEGWDGSWRRTDPAPDEDPVLVTREGVDALRRILSEDR